MNMQNIKGTETSPLVWDSYKSHPAASEKAKKPYNHAVSLLLWTHDQKDIFAQSRYAFELSQNITTYDNSGKLKSHGTSFAEGFMLIPQAPFLVVYMSLLKMPL